MLAAEIWHWWIGLALLAGGVLIGGGLLGTYLKVISAQKYPGGKRHRDNDL